jgi:hypothetical protein
VIAMEDITRQTTEKKELRWIAEIRDDINQSSGLFSGELLVQKIRGDIELHAYLSLEYKPDKKLQGVVRSVFKKESRKKTKDYIVQRVEFKAEAEIVRLVIFKKS